MPDLVRTNKPLYEAEVHLTIGGRKYFQSSANDIGGNVNDSEKSVRLLRAMILDGYPILLIKPAYDVEGNYLSEWTAVFIAVDAQDEVWDEYIRRRDSRSNRQPDYGPETLG